MLQYLAILFAISLGLQIFVFSIAVIRQTDKLTDIAYGTGFIALAFIALLYEGSWNTNAIISVILVTLWALRISIYLFVRILTMGRDKRFDGIREKTLSFLKFFILQGVAIWVISLPTLLLIYLNHPVKATIHLAQVMGIVIFLLGIAIETIADYQKYMFKINTNNDKWIQTGLWKYSRHPNYFGEILVWWGIFTYSVGITTEYWWISLLSPLCITILLLFVSGIPPLEKRHNEKYGENKDYEDYKHSTRLLIPIPKLSK